jgi:hypothetical protein
MEEERFDRILRSLLESVFEAENQGNPMQLRDLGDDLANLRALLVARRLNHISIELDPISLQPVVFIKPRGIRYLSRQRGGGKNG